MAYKASIGGTLGRAKIGYLNVREKFEGREVATIAIDEDRAPLVRLAFELYTTGTYTLDSLAEVLEERGSNPSIWQATRSADLAQQSRHHPAGPLLHQLRTLRGQRTPRPSPAPCWPSPSGSTRA
jgi:hypothetical protein